MTLLGVIIGVASVVVVGASISGLNYYVMDRVTKVLGANHFMMARMARTGDMEDEEFERMMKKNRKLEWDEYEYLKANCDLCSEVGAQKNSGSDIKFEDEEMVSVRIRGVTSNMLLIEDKTIDQGRFIINSEVKRKRQSMCIGY